MKTLTLKVWSDEELEALPKERGKFELIDGKLTRMSPAGGDHGRYEIIIGGALHAFVAPRKPGGVFGPSTGFRLDPENLLSPDVAYASVSRLREKNENLEQFVRGVPELVVEIISPSERRRRINLKLQKYFARGTRLAWLVYPRRKTVEVYTSLEAKILKRLGEELNGGDVLPGFRLPLAEIFADWF